jgi:hypothetical protein
VFVRVTKVDVREQNANSNFDIHLVTHYAVFEETTKMLRIFKARLMSNLTERFLDLNTFLSPARSDPLD